MRAPLSWLRDYAPLNAPLDKLTSTLSELGLVVDAVERVGEGLGDVVVARVLAIRPHPNADRIRLIDVDPGDGGPLQIVCGAWNFSVGDLVPLAPVGAQLPGDFKIKRQKMRGEISNGMLCSPRELEVPEPPGSEDGLLILEPGSAPPGAPIAEALGITPDVVFDLDVTPNRPDALSIAGVARDLAAALGETWSRPADPVAVPVDESLGQAPVTVQAGDLCPRFTATILSGVPNGPSPDWMARRLTLAGMRPINGIVDVSNYVMLDVGQPNHAYDLDRLGGGGILVRRGRPGESMETLDGEKRALDTTDCVICDAEDAPVGVGAIMGGANSEIAEGTSRVLLEAAWFDPATVARTGKRLGLHSEARVRFERGVDPELAPVAISRFISLLASIPGGERLRRGPTVDVIDPATIPARPRLVLRTERVNALLGTAFSDGQIVDLLAPIGFECSAEMPGLTAVEVPSWRLECSREIDLVEEVARMWGYRRIERSLPAGSRSSSEGLNPRQRERRRIRQVLTGAGYSEAWTTTFLAPGDLARAGLGEAKDQVVEVENPLDKSESILRSALLPGLLKAARFNVDRQAGSVCLFEIGRVFGAPRTDAPTPYEEERLGVIVVPAGVPGPAAAGGDTVAAAAAARTWRWLSDALRLSAVTVEAGEMAGFHPGRSARIMASSGAVLGQLGEIAFEVADAYGLAGRIGYLTVSLDALTVEPRRPRLARDVSRYPASDIDLAFVVGDDVAASAVQASLADAGGSDLESVVLFDVFRGAQLGSGRRSLAFRLRFRAADHTLNDSEVAARRSAAIERVGADHGGQLRG